jgi:uncharacterized LabA/DUF88 family protein
MVDRVGVFIDYQNVFGTARQCFHSPPRSSVDGQVDPRRLAELLVARRRRPSTLARVRVYRGLPDASLQPKAYAANERQAAAWLRSGVEVLRRPLRYPADFPAQRAEEKGVDVALGIDFVRLAVQGAYDVGILMSTDTDLLPALEAVMSIKTVRVHVEVAAWAGKGANRRLSLDGLLPWCHQLRAADYRAVRDETDYRKS